MSKFVKLFMIKHLRANVTKVVMTGMGGSNRFTFLMNRNEKMPDLSGNYFHFF